MADFPFVLGIEDAAGIPVDPLREDGTRAPIVIRLDPSIQGAPEIDGGITRITISVGVDGVDGDMLAVDYVPSNYTRTTAPPEVDALTQLTAHLAGIDTSLGVGGPVASVFGRGGAVVAVSGDYTASLIPFTPDGDITATDTQAAVVELRDDTDAKISSASPTSLTESGGPTALAIGAVPDGQLLARSGATLVGANVPPLAVNRVVVQSLSDLPAPVSGDITLAGSTEYDFQGNVSISPNRLIVDAAGTVIRGNHRDTNSITTSNATEVIRSDKVALQLQGLSVANLGAGGSVYCLDSPAALASDVRLCALAGLLSIDGAAVALVNDTVMLSGTVIDGSCGEVIFTRGNWGSFPVCLDIPLGASVTRLLGLDGCLFSSISTDTCIRANSQGQVSRAKLDRIEFGQSTTPMVGATEASDNWELTDVIGNISQSQDEGVSTFDGAGTPGTVALSTGQVWADVSDGGTNISYALDSDAQKFTLASANTGELTYNGVVSKSFKLGANLSYERVGGQDVRCQVAIAKNGTVINSTTVNITTANGMNTTAIQLSFVPLVTGDTLRLRVRNVDGTNPGNDISVGFATLTVGY